MSLERYLCIFGHGDDQPLNQCISLFLHFCFVLCFSAAFWPQPSLVTLSQLQYLKFSQNTHSSGVAFSISPSQTGAAQSTALTSPSFASPPGLGCAENHRFRNLDIRLCSRSSFSVTYASQDAPIKQVKKSLKGNLNQQKALCPHRKLESITTLQIK